MIEFKPVKFQKILVAMDDSVDSMNAFNYAVNRAKTDGAELAIVSVLELNQINVYEALSKDYIAKKRAEVELSVKEWEKAAEDFGVQKVIYFIDEGTPGETIIKKTLPAYKPDLLVCGSQTKRRVENIFIGSQAAYMASKATCSVYVAR